MSYTEQYNFLLVCMAQGMSYAQYLAAAKAAGFTLIPWSK